MRKEAVIYPWPEEGCGYNLMTQIVLRQDLLSDKPPN
jgi:hypothetical protein